MEMNPEHPVTEKMHEQWHKIVALMMARDGLTSLSIPVEDVPKLEGQNVVIFFTDNSIELRLVGEEQAKELLLTPDRVPDVL